MKRQSSFPLFITKNGNQIPQFFFFLLCGPISERRGTTRFKGNCHYLCAPSEPTLGKAERHPPYKDKHDKGDNTCCLIALDKKPRVRPKAISTRNIRQQNNSKVQGQDTSLTALDESTKSKTEATRTTTPQETRTYIHKKDIILLHPAGLITTFAIRKQGDFKEEPTSTRDIGLGLQLLLLHKTTCIVNERKTRSFCASTRLQTINASCEANQPSTS